MRDFAPWCFIPFGVAVTAAAALPEIDEKRPIRFDVPPRLIRL